MTNGTAIGARVNGFARRVHGLSVEQIADGWRCEKRDGHVVPFDCNKIRTALSKCFNEVGLLVETSGGLMTPEAATEKILQGVVNSILAQHVTQPDVEHVQRLVIQQLWAAGLFDAAEHYQNYREAHRKQRALETSVVFGSRAEFKPFDFPDAARFKEAIQQSPWTVKEFDPLSDVQDYKVGMLPAEQSACARTLLAISQIEVDLKKFWKRLGDRFPRAEFDQVGVEFAANEVRHADAYSRALDVLGLNSAFSTVTAVPAIKSRIDYIKRAMRVGQQGSDRDFAKVLAMFSLLIENVSLFSQFVIVRSLYQHKGLMKNTDNIVQATMKEETVHALFGGWLCNLIKSDRPEWFGPVFQDDLRQVCLEAYTAEQNILDWIFAEGQINTVSRPALDAFLKDRINQGAGMIGCDPVFDAVGGELSELDWFVRELKVPVQVDFFWKKATTYTSSDVDLSADTMW